MMTSRPQLVPGYDPSMRRFADEAENRWGDPEENRKKALLYGLNHLDNAVYGIDTEFGQLDVIQAPEKSRKTTLVLNIIANIMEAKLPNPKPFVGFDTLESGSPPAKVFDQWIAIIASRYLMREGHKANEYCPVCEGPVCRELHLNPDFFRYHSRSKRQKVAIDYGLTMAREWPVDIYGPHKDEGATRDLEAALISPGRWWRMVEEAGVKIIVSDHVQQYRYGASTGLLSDYEKQMKAVSLIGEFVAENHAAVFMLSQVSLTSIREENSGAGKQTAAGGRKASQEAVNIFGCEYESKSDPGSMGIRIVDSRKAPQFTFRQNLDPVSGAFYGDTYK